MNFSDTNFLKLIRSFSGKEIKEFEKYISSPFFNSQNSLILIYRELIRFYPDFRSTELTKENIFKSVFPGKEFNDTLLRKYISNLMKLAEDYLIYKDISENEDRRLTCLLDQFEKRHLTIFFKRQMEKTKNDLSPDHKIHVETFYYKHFREDLKTSYFIRINKLHHIKSCLIRSHIYILMHVLLTGTVYTNMMLIVQKSYKDPGDHDYFDKFNSVFDLIGYLEKVSELVDTERMFVALCKIDNIIIRDPFNTDNLFVMKDLIFKMSDTLSTNLLYTFFSHLNIYYLLNISKNKEDLIRDLFENYKFMIERGLYISDEREFINFSEYRTILLYSLRLNEFDWAENFIHQYKAFHNPDMRENVLNYSLAMLSFEKKDYNLSMQLISLLKVNDMTIKMDADILLLLIYYEKNFIDNALSLIDSFRHYMLENRILSREVIANHIDFLKYYRMLLMKKNNNSYLVDLEMIRNEISCNNNLRRKSWLLRKIDEEFLKLKAV